MLALAIVPPLPQVTLFLTLMSKRGCSLRLLFGTSATATTRITNNISINNATTKTVDQSKFTERVLALQVEGQGRRKGL